MNANDWIALGTAIGMLAFLVLVWRWSVKYVRPASEWRKEAMKWKMAYIRAESRRLEPPPHWRPQYCEQMECIHRCSEWAFDEQEVDGAFCAYQHAPPAPGSDWHIEGICPNVAVRAGSATLAGRQAWAWFVANSIPEREADSNAGSPDAE